MGEEEKERERLLMGILDDKNVLKLIMAMVMPSENILKNTDWKKHSPKKDSECHSLG